MPILSDRVCQQRWRDYLPATELCAGYKDYNYYKDFCAASIKVFIYFFFFSILGFIKTICLTYLSTTHNSQTGL